MRLTTKGRFAVTAMIDLALRDQEKDLARLGEELERVGERLGQLLVTLGLCAQRDVTEALAPAVMAPPQATTAMAVGAWRNTPFMRVSR